MVQIGSVEEEEKPKFAGLLPHQKISNISLEESLELFKLPCYLGDFENEKVESNAGRFGPYIKHNNVFVSLPKGLNPLEVTLEQSIELILEKRRIDAPIGKYEGHDISKGKGTPINGLDHMILYELKKISDKEYSDMNDSDLDNDRLSKGWSIYKMEWFIYKCK